MAMHDRLQLHTDTVLYIYKMYFRPTSGQVTRRNNIDDIHITIHYSFNMADVTLSFKIKIHIQEYFSDILRPTWGPVDWQNNLQTLSLEEWCNQGNFPKSQTCYVLQEQFPSAQNWTKPVFIWNCYLSKKNELNCRRLITLD